MENVERELTLLPAGVRAYLPEKSRQKRKLINRLFDLAHQHDFSELDLPTIDYYDSITRGVSDFLAARTYQFYDGKGERLALRPDATAQVAKILSGRLEKESLPGRYCYCCRSFRDFELRRGEAREFQQFGSEILGSNCFEADRDLLFFMFKMLDCCELEEYIVDLGHVGVYQGLIFDLGLSSGLERKIWKCIHRKNQAELSATLSSADLSAERKEALVTLPELYGGEEVFKTANKIKNHSEQTDRALRYLEKLYQELKEAGLAEVVSIDLGVVRDLDYYTGLVFEALVPGTGKPVVGGGRYDELYSSYGVEMPATGLALEIERILKSDAI